VENRLCRIHFWRWLSVLLTLWFEGESPLPRYGGECASSTASLWINYRHPRITRKSYRPRASDRTMVDTFQPRSLSCFRTRERRHDNEMNLEKEKVPRDSQHDMGWKAQRRFSLLPVAGDLFSLTLPFIERGNRTSITRPASAKTVLW